MIYREYRPKPPLAPWIASLWFVRTPYPDAVRQRVLPTGQAEIVLNLAADECIGCAEDVPDWREPPALLVGARTAFGVIDARDLREMMGVSFAPGGLSMFLGEAANRLTAELDLETLWGSAVHRLRERLCETRDIQAKFAVLENFLTARVLSRPLHPSVRYALYRIATGRNSPTVEELARSAGLSSRRFSDLFSEAVGLNPKAYLRIRRFRRALVRLHAGSDPCWAQMALDLGYCDQAHFNRDFREFSGITPTEYYAAERPWAGHVTLSSAT